MKCSDERGDTSPRCSPKSEIKALQVTLWPRSLLWRTFILLAALVLATTSVVWNGTCSDRSSSICEVTQSPGGRSMMK